jgi:hypothetical protein
MVMGWIILVMFAHAMAPIHSSGQHSQEWWGVHKQGYSDAPYFAANQ